MNKRSLHLPAVSLFLLADACELTLDPNTAQEHLLLSQRAKQVTCTQAQSDPDHPERFEHRRQVLCTNGLTGRCYWEVECRGVVDVGVAYRGIGRKGRRDDSLLGWNDKSWCLESCNDIAWHNGKVRGQRSSHHGSKTVAVYVDWPAGTLSFYSVYSNALIHLNTFSCTVTEPLYPAFRVLGYGSYALLRTC